MAALLSLLVACATLGTASPVGPRNVSSLNAAAFAEAQQRDNSATRAFSNVQIQVREPNVRGVLPVWSKADSSPKTSDGRCLFVDELSGDFRANLTPIQVGTCGATGATDGQGWDVITKGEHNNAANSMLVVSTLTQACFNFDPRRAAGNQVLLFSCGGRADGGRPMLYAVAFSPHDADFCLLEGGGVTNSQLFTFNGGSGPLSFQPENAAGSCLTVKGSVLDVAQCNSGDANQSFTFGGAAAAANGTTTAAPSPDETAVAASASGAATISSVSTGDAADGTGSQEATSAPSSSETEETASAAQETPTATETASSAGETTDTAGAAVVNPTSAVPVSGAGGTLNPTAVAEAQQRDDTATRAFSGAEIRAPNGQCLSVDPTAGDFRENLIPIGLVNCSGTPNEKWDVITAGKHNDAKDSALIVSSLVRSRHGPC